MKALIFGLLFDIVSASKECTLDEDMKHQYTDCDNEAFTTNLFFYYPNELHCDLRASDPIPPFMANIKCDNLCSDGEFLKVKMDKKKKPMLECGKCPNNAIAISGGFLYDARMETKKYFPDKSNPILANFKTSCYMVDYSAAAQGKPLRERLSTGCQSWTPSGESLVAQHPSEDRSVGAIKSYVEYTMTYEGTFNEASSVAFEYRSG